MERWEGGSVPGGPSAKLRKRQKACEPGSRRFGLSERLTRGCVPSSAGKGQENLLPCGSRKKAVYPRPLGPLFACLPLVLPTYAAAPPMPPNP